MSRILRVSFASFAWFVLSAHLALCLGCSKEPTTIVAALSSSLQIPNEANSLEVKISSEGEVLETASYPLGDPDRATWPQTLPIVRGERKLKSIRIAIELRLSYPQMPSLVVGFVEQSAEFPEEGRQDVVIEIPRACEDPDGDEFGVGFGCRGPDCDESRSDVPSTIDCDGVPLPDAGMPLDADTSGEDAGRTDAGRPDSGSVLCNSVACASDERCVQGLCLTICDGVEDCPSVFYNCVPRANVCVCRIPCPSGGDQYCSPYRCIDGCCGE